MHSEATLWGSLGTSVSEAKLDLGPESPGVAVAFGHRDSGSAGWPGWQVCAERCGRLVSTRARLSLQGHLRRRGRAGSGVGHCVQPLTRPQPPTPCHHLRRGPQPCCVREHTGHLCMGPFTERQESGGPSPLPNTPEWLLIPKVKSTPDSLASSQRPPAPQLTQSHACAHCPSIPEAIPTRCLSSPFP